MALGLPIKIVVLTIIGTAGLAAMLVIINASESAIPKPMHADLKSSNLIILSESSDTIELLVEVTSSKDGAPVGKASTALSGLNTIAINITDNKGVAIFKFNKTDFDMDVEEGYLRLDVKATGFYDYTNEYAVKIVK